MKSAITRVLGCALAVYCAAWLVGFAAFVGEWALLGHYLVPVTAAKEGTIVVWSFGGGERSTYLHLFALIAGSLGGVFGGIWHLHRHRKP